METAEAFALHDQLLAEKPDGVRHDRDICPICVDKATETAAPPSDPSRSGGPDVSEDQNPNTKGGTTDTMSDTASTISQETHSALVKAAVDQATEATDKLLQKATADLETANATLTQVTAERDTLKADNDRINGELDKAQVDLKTATDKAAQLESDIAKEREDREKADLASKRAEQVRNLKVFPDEYVTSEKAEAWAGLDEAAWTERIEEWTTAAPKAAGDGATTTDSASALTGTSESLTTGGDTASDTTKPNARRAALGLT